MSILVDPVHDDQLAAEGYVVVDLFTAPQVAALQALWADFEADRASTWDDRGFFTSAYAGEWQQDVDRALRTPYADQVESQFVDYEVFLSAFIAKRPGASGITPHLDWSYVDESVRPTFHGWTALQRIDRSNGALCVLPASHRQVTFQRTLADQGLDWASATFEAQATECRLVPLEAARR